MEETRLSAYYKWVKAGSPVSDGIEFWLEAENEIINRQFLKKKKPTLLERLFPALVKNERTN